MEKPLSGIKILVTRAKEQGSQFSSLLNKEGAEVLELPVISFEPPSNPGLLNQAIYNLGKYDWIIFTSVNGVKAFWNTLNNSKTSFPSKLRVAAIGPATKRSIEERGVSVSLTPSNLFQAEGLLETFTGAGAGNHNIMGKDTKILIPRAEEARRTLTDELRLRGALVDEVPAYKTVLPSGFNHDILKLLEQNLIDAVTFTASSTVKHFLTLLRRKGLHPEILFKKNAEDIEGPVPGKTAGGGVIACIGPITAREVEKQGFKVDFTASRSTIPDFAQGLADYFAASKKRCR